MSIKKTIVICMFIGAIACGLSVHAKTCVPTNFNVSYTCNGGSLRGVLPSDEVATYGELFSPTYITTSVCAPPTGTVLGGYEITVDGETVVVYNSASSFTYYYDTDIEIGPYWLPLAAVPTLATKLGVAGTDHSYVTAAFGTWQVVFPYGVVNGESRCVNVSSENIGYGYYTGLIASDQAAVESASVGGRYCYCKMTEPYIAASPWVFRRDHEDASDCASKCADLCGYNLMLEDGNGKRFRASVFQGAVSELSGI